MDLDLTVLLLSSTSIMELIISSLGITMSTSIPITSILML